MLQWDDPEPGFRWPVAVARAIPAPADQVWATIAMPGNLEPCHPFCAANPVHAWPGDNSRDEVHYLNGLIFERRFCHWYEGVGYDLEVGRSGSSRSFVSWRIHPDADARAILRISVYPQVLQGLSSAVRWLPHLVWLKPRLVQYLSAVLRGFEWYILRGEAVPRNHFGKHPWFSAPAKG